jgi:hypothetical protein
MEKGAGIVRLVLAWAAVDRAKVLTVTAHAAIR